MRAATVIPHTILSALVYKRPVQIPEYNEPETSVLLAVPVALCIDSLKYKLGSDTRSVEDAMRGLALPTYQAHAVRQPKRACGPIVESTVAAIDGA